MRILLLVHGFNSLSQRIFVELEERGHDVSVEFDINDVVLHEAVQLFSPDIIVAPFLKRAIPKSIWKSLPCLIIHPGIRGDRGPSALDWAVFNEEKNWGVTILQAETEMDAGPVWASVEFPVRSDATKSSLYRNEVSDAAVEGLLLALQRMQDGQFVPERLCADDPTVRGRKRPPIKQSNRKIDWQQDTTQSILHKIRSADGMPGVKDEIFDLPVRLFDAHTAPGLSGTPGDVIAKSGPAICRATTDGAIWIGHIINDHSRHKFKLPATVALQQHVSGLPEIPVDTDQGYCEIRYEEEGDVGFLHFSFYNGAMSSAQCERLLNAYKMAIKRPTSVSVLMGGPDFWSNGMHLNLIEASESAADESWRNINAMDDLAEEIIRTTDRLTVAAIQGNTGAGGVFLARAADYVWLRDGVILNPHYKDMGNLYGSEFWTYLLPRYAGPENANKISQARLPMGTREAVRLGLGDAHFGKNQSEFCKEVKSRAAALSDKKHIDAHLEKKSAWRTAEESACPLSTYRSTELERMRMNFFGFDPSYHIARYNFVHKVPKSRTPVTIARHRDQRLLDQNRRKAS